jgi:signal transduction histidine kinase
MLLMIALFSHLFRGRPTAKVVALFSGLNGLMILLLSLARLAPTPAGGMAPVLFQPAWLLVHVLLASTLYGAVIYSLRPGTRNPWWLAVLTLLGLGTLALLTVYLNPLLSLALIPIVARYWLDLRQTLVIAAALTLWSVVWNSVGEMSQYNPPAITIAVVVILALIFGGYTLLSFDFAMREARAREERDGLYAELERSYERLGRYHDLELEHAHLAERTRISRELHDTLGHHLTAQHFDLHVLKRLLPADETLAGALQRALDRNREALEDVRRAVHALRPEQLEGLSLSQALRQLVMLSAESLKVRLEVCGRECELSSDKALALYRLAQESLTNRAKHAPGQPLDVRLRFKSTDVEFEACNPKRENQPAAGTGLGLCGLRERIEALGGQLHAGEREGYFRVWASLPL